MNSYFDDLIARGRLLTNDFIACEIVYHELEIEMLL